MAAGLGRRAGPAPGTDDWHTDRPAVLAEGARAGVKEKMAVRHRRKEDGTARASGVVAADATEEQRAE